VKACGAVESLLHAFSTLVLGESAW